MTTKDDSIVLAALIGLMPVVFAWGLYYYRKWKARRVCVRELVDREMIFVNLHDGDDIVGNGTLVVSKGTYDGSLD